MRNLSLVFLVLACACESETHGGPSSTTPGTDAGQDTGPTTSDAGPRVKDHGVIQDFDTKRALKGATASEGDQSTTSDDQGLWSLTVPANTPLTLLTTAPDFSSIQWPEELLSADHDRGPFTLVSLSTFHFVGGSLENYDHSLGVLYIGLHNIGSCADVVGATANVVAPTGAIVHYFKHGIPTKSQTSVAAGEVPAIAIYNVQNNTPVKVEIVHPKCKMVPFPHTEAEVTYTGNITTTGGDASTYAEFFIQ